VSAIPSHNNLVSVVMPVKNAAAFLADTLQSVLAQDWQKWELIAVDDHSTDESRNLLEDFSQRDGRIKWMPNQGHGILPALQTGANQTTGKFITRMDADDLMTPYRMSSQLKLLKKTGSGYICTGKVKYISTAGKPGEGFRKYENWLNSLCDTGSHFSEIYKECVIPSPAWMMYTDDFHKTGGFSRLEYPEDYDFVFRLYAKGIKVAAVPDEILLWRDHPARASRNLPQYSDQTFFPLKWKWFRKLEYRPEQKLILYGAGPKGKKTGETYY
jgi:glycosyltransferase involved in cell wall biosynthesis